MSNRKRSDIEAAEALLEYMVPGTTIDDLLDDSDYDSADDDTFLTNENGAGGSTRAAQQLDVVASKSGLVVVKAAAGTAPNTQAAQSSMSKVQPQQHTVSNQVLSRIRIDGFVDSERGGGGGGGKRMNQKVLNELRDATTSSNLNARKEVDRSERATVEQVMDPRTRMILYKLVNSGLLQEINGCVSTGKEANVYYSVSQDGSPVALKVYKTSILVFKDRDQYVQGEFRFQRYCKSNPRKMVRTWAEKEARNLGRLANAGVNAPRVRILRQHVLVMDFIGDDGWPAPRLKEVSFPSEKLLDSFYLNLCCVIRIMYTQCRLVHGDLSEYNLLVHDGKLFVIDVSQSVEHDHMHAMNFLRRDIVNCNRFFRNAGHRQLFRLQDLYDFVTSSDMKRCGKDEAGMLIYLKKLREQQEAAAEAEQSDDDEEEEEVNDDGEPTTRQKKTAKSNNQDEVDEQVFLRVDVPRNLMEVREDKAPNRDVAGFVQGMLAKEGKAAADSKRETASRSPSNSDSSSSSSDSGDDEEGCDKSDANHEGAGNATSNVAAATPKTLAEMTKEERKEHKKGVKQANRERRETKKESKAHKKHSTRRVKHK